MNHCCLCSNPAKYEHMYKQYCKECIKRVTIAADVYSRIVGYIRPLRSWSQHKKNEFYIDRKTYVLEHMEEPQGVGMAND